MNSASISTGERHETMLPPPGAGQEGQDRRPRALPPVPRGAVGFECGPMDAEEMRGRRETLARRLFLPDLRDDQEPFFQVFHVLVAASLLDIFVAASPVWMIGVMRGVDGGRWLAALLATFCAVSTVAWMRAMRTRKWPLSRQVLRIYREHHALGGRIHGLERLAERDDGR